VAFPVWWVKCVFLVLAASIDTVASEQKRSSFLRQRGSQLPGLKEHDNKARKPDNIKILQYKRDSNAMALDLGRDAEAGLHAGVVVVVHVALDLGERVRSSLKARREA
jgi:hypothetical protein